MITAIKIQIGPCARSDWSKTSVLSEYKTQKMRVLLFFTTLPLQAFLVFFQLPARFIASVNPQKEWSISYVVTILYKAQGTQNSFLDTASDDVLSFPLIHSREINIGEKYETFNVKKLPRTKPVTHQIKISHLKLFLRARKPFKLSIELKTRIITFSPKKNYYFSFRGKNLKC